MIERYMLCRAYGAEVRCSDPALGSKGFIDLAKQVGQSSLPANSRLDMLNTMKTFQLLQLSEKGHVVVQVAAETPDSFMLRQFDNPDNTRAHYEGQRLARSLQDPMVTQPRSHVSCSHPVRVGGRNWP